MGQQGGRQAAVRRSSTPEKPCARRHGPHSPAAHRPTSSPAAQGQPHPQPSSKQAAAQQPSLSQPSGRALQPQSSSPAGPPAPLSPRLFQLPSLCPPSSSSSRTSAPQLLSSPAHSTATESQVSQLREAPQPSPTTPQPPIPPLPRLHSPLSLSPRPGLFQERAGRRAEGQHSAARALT